MGRSSRRVGGLRRDIDFGSDWDWDMEYDEHNFVLTGFLRTNLFPIMRPSQVRR